MADLRTLRPSPTMMSLEDLLAMVAKLAKARRTVIGKGTAVKAKKVKKTKEAMAQG